MNGARRRWILGIVVVGGVVGLWSSAHLLLEPWSHEIVIRNARAADTGEEVRAILVSPLCRVDNEQGHGIELDHYSGIVSILVDHGDGLRYERHRKVFVRFSPGKTGADVFLDQTPE